MKLFSKILTERLENILDSLISPNKVLNVTSRFKMDFVSKITEEYITKKLF